VPINRRRCEIRKTFFFNPSSANAPYFAFEGYLFTGRRHVFKRPPWESPTKVRRLPPLHCLAGPRIPSSSIKLPRVVAIDQPPRDPRESFRGVTSHDTAHTRVFICNYTATYESRRTTVAVIWPEIRK